MKYVTGILAALCVSSAFCFITETHVTEANSSTDDPCIPARISIGKFTFPVKCTSVLLRYGGSEVLPDGSLLVDAYDIKIDQSVIDFFNALNTICNQTAKNGGSFDNYKINNAHSRGYSYRGVALALVMTQYFILMVALFVSSFYFTFSDDVSRLINGTYIVLFMSFIFLLLDTAITIYGNPLFPGDSRLRFPNMNDYVFFTFFIWLTAIIYHGIQSHYRVEELQLNSNDTGLPVDYRYPVIHTCVRMALVLIISVLLESLHLIRLPREIESLESVKVLFFYLIHPLVAYFTISCVTVFISNHSKLRDGSPNEKMNIIKKFYETHLLLFIIVAMSWVLIYLVFTCETDGIKYVALCVQFFQACVLFIAVVLIHSEAFDSENSQ